MAEKLFDFTIKNLRTGEVAGFLGQGETIAQAKLDGTKLVQETFRPKNDGKSRPPVGVKVTLPDGRIVWRTLQEFESDVPYGVVETGAPASGGEVLDVEV